MNAHESFKAGRLQEAIDAQIQDVKAHPGDPNCRLFLFELAAFTGDFDRARRQIDAVKYEDIDRDTAVQGYRKLLDAEELRRRLFREGVRPRFLVEPPEHVNWRLDAVNLLRQGKHAEAREILDRANEALSVKGQLNDKPFEELRDCDDLFGTVVEVMAHGQYFWVPLEQIDALSMNPPKAPRDVLWVHANLEMGGSIGEVFLPALYPGSHEHPDDQVKLGRMTDWKSEEGGPVLGHGVRTYLVDEGSVDLLQWRELLVAHEGEEEEKG
jgi:type VI secretion system protein ImpE